MQSAETVPTQVLVDLVVSLGGPSIQPQEIDWILDIPVGAHLERWLNTHMQDDSLIRDYALEVEELEIWKRAKTANLVSDGCSSIAVAPAAYFTPSRLRSRIQNLREQHRLTEVYRAQLGHRKEILTSLRSRKAQVVDYLRNRSAGALDTTSSSERAVANLLLKDNPTSTLVRKARKYIARPVASGCPNTAYELVPRADDLSDALRLCLQEIQHSFHRQNDVGFPPYEPNIPRPYAAFHAQNLEQSFRRHETVEYLGQLEETRQSLDSGLHWKTLTRSADSYVNIEDNLETTALLRALIHEAFALDTFERSVSNQVFLEKAICNTHQVLLPTLALLHHLQTQSETCFHNAWGFIQSLLFELQNPVVEGQSPHHFSETSTEATGTLRHLSKGSQLQVPNDSVSVTFTSVHDTSSTNHMIDGVQVIALDATAKKECREVYEKELQTSYDFRGLCGDVPNSLALLHSTNASLLSVISPRVAPYGLPMDLPQPLQKLEAEMESEAKGVKAVLSAIEPTVAMNSRCRRRLDFAVEGQ